VRTAGEGDAEDCVPSLLVTAGERHLYLTLSLLSAHLLRYRPVGIVCIVDTSHSGLRGRNRWLARRIGRRLLVVPARGEPQLSALRTGLRTLDEIGAETCLAVEEDFVLGPGCGIEVCRELSRRPGTLQVVLARQRWFAAEYRFSSMREYLLARRGGIECGSSVVLPGFFTTNPSVFEVSTLRRLVDEVDAPSTPDFELSIGDAARRAGLATTVVFGRHDRPLVLHIGALTTSRLTRRGRVPTAVLYAVVHVRRTWVVAGRLLGEVSRRPHEGRSATR
jgi:hypothetical protein